MVALENPKGCHCNGDTPIQCLEPGNKVASCPQPQILKDPGGHPEEKGVPWQALEEEGEEELGRGWGAPAVMEQSPGRCGTPAEGCPASPGHGALVSAGMSGWEHEERAGETLSVWGLCTGATLTQEDSHVSPATSSSLVPHPAPRAPPVGTRTSGGLSPHHQHRAPATMAGRKPKTGSCGQPPEPDLAEDRARPPCHPASLRCRTVTGVSLRPTMSRTPQSHQRTPLGHSTEHPAPGSPMPKHYLGPKPRGRAHRSGHHGPLRAHIAPATRLHHRCRPSCVTNFIFWEILHFKAVDLVWTSAGTAPPVPSLPRLLVSMQGSVGYFYYY